MEYDFDMWGSDGEPAGIETSLVFHIDAEPQVVRDWLLKLDLATLEVGPFKNSRHRLERITVWQPGAVDEKTEDSQETDPPHLVSFPGRFMKLRLASHGLGRTQLTFTLETHCFHDWKYVDLGEHRTECVHFWDHEDESQATRAVCLLLQRIGMVWPTSRPIIDYELTRVRHRFRMATRDDPLRHADLVRSQSERISYDGSAEPNNPTAPTRDVSKSRVTESEMAGSQEESKRRYVKNKLPKTPQARQRWKAVYKMAAPLHTAGQTIKEIRAHIEKASRSLPSDEDTISLVLRAGDAGLLDDS